MRNWMSGLWGLHCSELSRERVVVVQHHLEFSHCCAIQAGGMRHSVVSFMICVMYVQLRKLRDVLLCWGLQGTNHVVDEAVHSEAPKPAKRSTDDQNSPGHAPQICKLDHNSTNTYREHKAMLLTPGMQHRAERRSPRLRLSSTQRPNEAIWNAAL